MNSSLSSGSETKMTGQQTPGSKIQQRMALLRAVTTPPGHENRLREAAVIKVSSTMKL